MADKKLQYLTTGAGGEPPVDLHIPVMYTGETQKQKTNGVNIPVFVSPVESYPNMITIKRIKR